MVPPNFAAVFALCWLYCFGAAQAKRGVGEGEQDWGYVTVRQNAHMFWWLYYCNSKDQKVYTCDYKEKPLVIWLQGGPGGSSTGYGNFMEIGPYDYNLKYRDTTWVQDYSVMFIDNPVGTGFSYVDNDNAFAVNNAQIAKDLLELMRGFYKQLPQFLEIPTYILCESYGGKMAAEFALLWYQAQKSGGIKSNLRGVGLGDAWISPVDTVLTYAPYLLQTGMVDTDGYNKIDAAAKQTKTAVEKGQWLQATDLWDNTLNVTVKVTGNIDVYNILNPVQLQMSTSPNNKMLTQVLTRKLAASNGNTLDDLMNGQVKSTLELSVTWGKQSDTVADKLEEDFMKPVTHVVERLLDETDLRVFVYNGHLDLIVDLPGQWQWIQNMKWSNKKLWQASPRTPLLVDDVIEGYRKLYKNFGFYCILRSGHMAPADNPMAVAVVLQELTKN